MSYNKKDNKTDSKQEDHYNWFEKANVRLSQWISIIILLSLAYTRPDVNKTEIYSWPREKKVKFSPNNPTRNQKGGSILFRVTQILNLGLIARLFKWLLKYCTPLLVPSGVIRAEFYIILSGPAIDPWSCLSGFSLQLRQIVGMQFFK